MNIQDILAKLQAPHEKLPYEVLKAAIADREQIIPELLQLIEWAQGEQDYLWENPDYLGHIYAMYLLAQFREKLAYPLIIEFFSSFDDEDEPTDNLGRILASVCGGDDSLIKGLIENEKAYKYARGEAIGALVSLVTCGEKTREEVLAYFQALFREKIKREPSNHIVWNYLIRHSTALYPEEVYVSSRIQTGNIFIALTTRIDEYIPVLHLYFFERLQAIRAKPGTHNLHTFQPGFRQ